MKKIFFFLTLILTFTFSASFDCSKATTDVEKLICSNEELSQLDDELNKAYKKLLSKVNDNDKKMIRQEQREWIKERDYTVEPDDVFGMVQFYNQSKLFKYISILDNRPAMIKQTMELQKIEHYPTYAEVLEDKNISFPKSSDRNLYSKVRPANNFKLIGGTKNPICKETIALFNEEGTYKIDTNWYAEGRYKPKPEDSDYLFWHLNNSGFILWETLDVHKYEYKSPKSINGGTEYVEIDIDNNGISEYAYRQNFMLRSYYSQKIVVFDKKLQNNTTLLENYRSKCEKIYGEHSCNNNSMALLSQAIEYENKWEFTNKMDEAMRRIIYDQKSIDILFPNNGLIMARNIIPMEFLKYSFSTLVEYAMQWNLYKIKSGVVMVLIPREWRQIPEFLVFSLHRDKPTTLECIIAPK